jgi:hypothetical protein
MTSLALVKVNSNLLLPATLNDEDFVKQWGVGQIVHADFKKMRNGRFFRKWWKLVEFVFEHWEPGEITLPRYGNVVPQKSFERFRKDLTILAGHYDATIRIDQTCRIEAKSISFGNMSEVEFERFYSATIDAALARIMTNYTRSDLDNVVEQLIRF